MNLFFLLTFTFYCVSLFPSYVNKTDTDISEKEISNKLIPVVDREYFPVTKKLVQEAKKSISISMFVVKGNGKIDTLLKEREVKL